MKIRNWDKVIKARKEEDWNDLLLCSGVKDLKHNICIPLFSLNSVRLVTTQTLTSDRNSAEQRDHWEIFNTDLLHFTHCCDNKKCTLLFTRILLGDIQIYFYLLSGGLSLAISKLTGLSIFEGESGDAIENAVLMLEFTILFEL